MSSETQAAQRYLQFELRPIFGGVLEEVLVIDDAYGSPIPVLIFRVGEKTFSVPVMRDAEGNGGRWLLRPEALPE